MRGRRRRKLLPSGRSVVPEPVSPELVLVDPELARRERAKLEERARLRAIHEADDLRRVLERTLDTAEAWDEPAVRQREVVAFARRRLVPAALLCSLLVNGFLAAKLLTRTDEATTSAAALLPARAVTSAAGGVTSIDSVKRNVAQLTSPETSQRTQIEKASVERKLVSLILAAPAGKLPRPFVDPMTGLIRNNVQVACRPGKKRVFLCLISSPTDRPGGGLVVRYRVAGNGSGVFRWSGYRK
jgi:hypothetical protein